MKKSILNLMQTHSKASLIVLFCALLVWVFLFLSWRFDGLPYWSDEFFYWTNAYSFYLHNHLEAVLSFDGEGSRWLGADAHGPTYPIFHGVVAKIIGWNTYNFQLINFLCMLLMMLMITRTRECNPHQKSAYLALIFSYPFFMIYGFGFLQEVIHGLIALLAAYLLLKIDRNRENQTWISLFALTILIGGLFRPLWFLWGLGLIPFYWERKKWFFVVLNLMIWPLFAGIFSFYLMEPLPNKFGLMLHELLNYTDVSAAFAILYDNTLDNLGAFFLDFGSIRYALMRPLFFLLILYFSWYAWKKPTTLIKSLLVIGWINFLLLILLYDAYHWRDIRTMSPLFYFLGFFFVIKASKKTIVIFQLLTVVSMLAMVSVALEEINFHKSVQADDINNIQKKVTDLLNHAELTQDSKIYVDKSFYMDYNIIGLPVMLIENKPLRYIIPYYDKEDVTYDYHLSVQDGEFKLKKAQNID